MYDYEPVFSSFYVMNDIHQETCQEIKSRTDSDYIQYRLVKRNLSFKHPEIHRTAKKEIDKFHVYAKHFSDFLFHIIV